MSSAAVGIDLGGTKLLMLSEADGARRAERVATGAAADAASIEAAIEAFIAQLPTAPPTVGLAVPGLVGAAGEVVACDVLPGIVGWRPAARLRVRGAPVFVLNDAAAALVEEAHGLPADATAAVVMAGTGVGGALMTAGRIVRGANGWAGELGSIPIAAGNGSVKTLDQLAGGAAILRQLGMDADAVHARAAAGDAAVLACLRDAGTALGLGLATIINLVNPQRIALAGGTLALPGYADAALRSAKAHALPDLWHACEVRTSPDGPLLVALGARRYASAQLHR
jgi:glucokinase